MTNKTEENIYVSLLIIMVVFSLSYGFATKNNSLESAHIVIGFFSGIFSILIGLVSIKKVIGSEMEYNNVYFLSSAFANFLNSLIAVHWLIHYIFNIPIDIGELNIIFLYTPSLITYLIVMLTLNIILFISQLVIFIKNKAIETNTP